MSTVATLIKNWPVFHDTDIKFSELVDAPMSPEEEFRNDGSRIVRTLFCEWDRRYELAYNILGYSLVWTDNGKQYIRRITPDAYYLKNPRTQAKFLYATQVIRCEPWCFPDQDANGRRVLRDANNNVATYGLARLQVQYETLPYEVVADADMVTKDSFNNPDESGLERYIVRLPQPAGESIPVPVGTGLYWIDHAGTGVGQGNSVGGFPHKIQPYDDLVYVWVDVPQAAIGLRSVNPAASSFPIDDARGKLNKATFAGYPAGTLLLESVSPKPKRSPFGERIWDVEFHIRQFSPKAPTIDASGTPQAAGVETVTHNHLLRKLTTDAGAAYVEVKFIASGDAAPYASNLVTKADGKSIQDYADFSAMFRVPN